jgi:hypothetical protein
MHHTDDHQHVDQHVEDVTDRHVTPRDLALVVLILVVLATAVVLALRGMRDADATVCGTNSDHVGQTLAADGLLRDVSTNHDLDATGAATPEGNSPC